MVLSPKNVLWPTDFSPLSLLAGRYARAFRDVFGARLHIVHVITPPMSPDLTVMVPTEAPAAFDDREMVQTALRGLKQIVDRDFGGDPKIVLEAIVGNPWSSICEYARTCDADLIIVPTHGRTGLMHMLIGSTAERIVQHAPCAVLTVKSGARDFLIE